MRAVATADFGSPPTIIELATPTPLPHEVTIEVHASSLNGFDLALANGYLKGLMEHRFPVVLGRDFAGVVDQVGDDVSRFRVGDEVFGVVLTQPLHAGGFADYLVVPEDHNIARVPAGMDLPAAGILGLAGAAAMASVDAIRPQAGETVLVAGATGGVGALAMQICVAQGATVIATAANDTEDDHVRRLGATHTVDYRGDLASAVRAIAPAGVQAVLHYAGDALALADLVAAGGRLASLLIAGVDTLADRDITARAVVANPESAVLEKLAAQAVAGQLVLPVQRTYTLEETPQAFADFAAGTIGKLAVRIK
jgi:NADPH:quinone reductase-like Zn-dependent oxidoreductase